MSGLLRAVDPSGQAQNLVCDNSKQLKVAVSGAGSGGTSAVDESAFSAGVTAGTPAMGVYEAAPTTLSDGQVGLIGLTTDRKVKVSGTLTTTPPAAGTSALTNVAENLASVALLAANASRLAFEIYNDSDGVLLVKPGATASLTSFAWRVMPRERLTSEALGVNYTGRLDGIWETTPGVAGHASARVTELTA